MPPVPNGQEFRPECNVIVFAPKPANSLFCGSKRKKKIRVNFVRKCPQVPNGQEFQPECKVAIFQRKHVDSIFSGLRNMWKIV